LVYKSKTVRCYIFCNCKDVICGRWNTQHDLKSAFGLCGMFCENTDFRVKYLYECFQFVIFEYLIIIDESTTCQNNWLHSGCNVRNLSIDMNVEHLSSPIVFSGVRVTRSLVLCVCFVDRCLSFLSWSLCCLFFFNLRILIIPLVSSNSS